jgi:UDP-N-acetylmuramoylalanine--D-glutamate ligase
MKEFNQNIAIIGMARTGMAAAEVLSSRGAQVVLHDQKEASQLSNAIQEAKQLGLPYRIGSEAFSGIEQAQIIVASPGMRREHPVLVAAHARGTDVVSEIEMAYRISPAPIIAITGTNGKTTTTALVGAILNACGKRALVGGNIAPGIPLIRQADQANPEDVLVAEVSTFQLEQIDRFEPKVGVLTNIGIDHLDRHGDLETYAALKAHLFVNQTPSDYAVLNRDNPKVLEATSSIRSTRLYFSRLQEVEQGAFMRGDELILRFNHDEIVVCTRDHIWLRGEHNLENVLAALAASAPFGLQPVDACRALEEFREVEHRMERVLTLQGVEFINNSMCTNTEAGVRSLEAMEKPTVLIAGGKDKGSDFAPLGKAIAEKAKHLVLIGADGELIGNAARAYGYDRISPAETLADAVSIAFQQAAPGDAVMLSPACASFDMFRDFEDRGRQFKEAVKQLASRIS